MMRIALISDDPDLVERAVDTLAPRASHVSSFPAESFLPAGQDLSEFDLAIFDLATAHQREVDMITDLRKESLIGIILLTTHFTREERAHAVKAGACNLLEKPADMEELDAAVVNLNGLSVGAAAPAPSRESDRGKAWTLDLDGGRLFAPAGHAIALSSAELALLEPLFRQPNTPLKREQLHGFKRDWTPTNSRSLDVVISKLRTKVEHEADEPFPLRSARGVGYIFVGTVTLIPRSEFAAAAE